MTRLIRVESCAGCPLSSPVSGSRVYCKGVVPVRLMTKKETEHARKGEAPPRWCPLEEMDL